MSASMMLGPGVVLPIAHLVVDDDGIKNLRNALGLAPQLPDPNPGETANDYATRTGTTLADELPGDHRYDPWATAPDGAAGWWIGPSDTFASPPGWGGMSPMVLGKALEAATQLETNTMLHLDLVCKAAAAHGWPILGYPSQGVLSAMDADVLRQILASASAAYGDVTESAPSEINDMQAETVLGYILAQL